MQLLKEELTFSSSVPKMFLESEIIFLSTSVQLVSSEMDCVCSAEVLCERQVIVAYDERHFWYE